MKPYNDASFYVIWHDKSTIANFQNNANTEIKNQF